MRSLPRDAQLGNESPSRLCVLIWCLSSHRGCNQNPPFSAQPGFSHFHNLSQGQINSRAMLEPSPGSRMSRWYGRDGLLIAGEGWQGEWDANSPVIHPCVPEQTLYLNGFYLNFSGFAAGIKKHPRAVKRLFLRCPNSAFLPFPYQDPPPWALRMNSI